ncbi:MAG TPA: PAS domain-containing protein [Syntrophobacteraceae bacterium]|nr:PAS domain-containing protein [Syntrophobacteraceae bacterium]
MDAWYWDLIEDKCYGDDQAFRLIRIESTRSAMGVERFFEAVHPDNHDKIRKARNSSVEQGLPHQVECSFLQPDGSFRSVSSRAGPVRDDHGRPLRLNGILRDISEGKWAEEKREESEDRLHWARKAESLGRMAGAIAHSFNNLFSVAIGRLEPAMTDLPPASGAAEDVAEAMTALERSANLCHLTLGSLADGLRAAR